jgi:hypothetical protein
MEKKRNRPRGERPAGPKGEKGEGRRGLGFFFLNYFQIHFSNFTETIKPSIRIMMHKQLLFLTLFK